LRQSDQEGHPRRRGAVAGEQGALRHAPGRARRCAQHERDGHLRFLQARHRDGEEAAMSYRLLSYQAEGGPRGGLSIDGKIYDLERETGFITVLAALRSQKPVAPKGRSEPVKNARLAAPVPDPGNIFCAGANYTDHMAEMARAHGNQPGP